MGARARVPRRHVPLPQSDGGHRRHHRQLPAFDGAQRQGFRLAPAPAQFRAVPLPARRRSQLRARRRDDAGHGRLFPGGHVLRPADQRGDRDDLRAAVRRLERPGLSVAEGSQAGHGCAARDRHVRRRRLPAQRRRARQAQHGRLPGDLGAGQRPAAAIPEAALRQAGDDGPGELRMGRARRISPACSRSCSACSPSGARKPACSGSTPARR